MPVATPCPAPTQGMRRYQSRPSISSTIDYFADDTANIEYTRAIKEDLSKAPPRRRSSLMRKPERSAPIKIFEDVPEGEELVVNVANPKIEGRTLLGKPAQRFPPVRVRKEEDQHRRGSLVAAPSNSHRRSSVLFDESSNADIRREHASRQITGTLPQTIKRDPRRRTIFIPSDDTTLMTIHPGAEATDCLNDTFQLPNYSKPVFQPQLTTERDNLDSKDTHKMPARRSARKSLSAAPRRMPLSHMASNLDNIPGLDVPGQNGGKENFPPYRLSANVGGKRRKVDDAQDNLPMPVINKEVTKSHISTQPVKAKQDLITSARATSIRNEARSKKVDAASKMNRTTYGVPNQQSPLHREDAKIGASSNIESKKAPLRDIIAAKRNEQQLAKLKQFPVLTENLSQPELYEDGWLVHQEIALAEIMNTVFDSYEQSTIKPDINLGSGLRHDLIALYHQPFVATLFQRLQASLMHGALSRPKETAYTPNPAHDLGLRKRFLSFWLDNYEEEYLTTACEVVVGRQITKQMDSTSAELEKAATVLDSHASRRPLVEFLETFLVMVSDTEILNSTGSVMESQELGETRWRKLMLRSLMLIWLLDHAKTSGVVRGRIFKRTALRKSSVSMLHGLSSMLIPAIGDIMRALKHMDYNVAHHQDALDEVTYQVHNLAIDLRDGVLLTHLVEILIHEKVLSQQSSSQNDTAALTLTMPDLTVLISTFDSATAASHTPPRILSQHLKVPCVSHAQQLHNVQVALSALSHYNMLDSHIITSVTATDIVNGHRERTLSLLWALLSVHGMRHMVDWDELDRDILRTQGLSPRLFPLAPNPSTPLDEHSSEQKLLAWANAHSLKHSHDSVSNLTTSFASGKPYLSIVTNFAPLIPTSPTSAPLTLSSSPLQSLPFSAAFKQHLLPHPSSTTTTLIPSRLTTLSTLLLLASRLLPLSRAHHAARTIQSAFRDFLHNRLLRRRKILQSLAANCAEIVRTRARIERAAIVLQRVWRGVLDARLKRLSDDVRMFQCWAKGWRVRERVAAEMGRGGSGRRGGAVAGW